jgi:hypothetical protein
VARQKLKDGKIEYRVRGTAGGNLLTVTYDVSAHTANLEVVKILIHATCSSKRKWMTIDIKDFYLGTPLPPGQYEYMRIHKSKISAATVSKHNLGPLLHENYFHFEIRKCLYGLPQSGKLSQDRLVSHLAKHGYTQSPNTPCLFKHATRDIIAFTLVVDDFGVSYSNQADVDHLITTLKANDYLLTIKDDGNTYLGMTIQFNPTLNTVNISMPGYLEKTLTRFRPHYLLPSHRAARTPGWPIHSP